MLVLVLDTSTPAVTAAVAVVVAPASVHVLAQRSPVDARAHGELLAPGIRAVLAEAGANARHLGAIVAGLGPGPFTGLRVGLVTAAALSQALDVPSYGVCSLDAIGGPAAGPGDGQILAVTDARRREIYWAVYQDRRRLTGPAVDRPEEVPTRLRAAGLHPVAAVGDGAPHYGDRLPVRPEPRYPDPAALAELAADRILRAEPSPPLVPLYLRRPDAAVPGSRKLVLR